MFVVWLGCRSGCTLKKPTALLLSALGVGGWVNGDMRGSAVFRCGSCGIALDRQLNATINLYLRMEGVPQQREWWDGNVPPGLVGACVRPDGGRRGRDQ